MSRMPTCRQSLSLGAMLFVLGGLASCQSKQPAADLPAKEVKPAAEQQAMQAPVPASHKLSAQPVVAAAATAKSGDACKDLNTLVGKGGDVKLESAFEFGAGDECEVPIERVTDIHGGSAVAFRFNKDKPNKDADKRHKVPTVIFSVQNKGAALTVRDLHTDGVAVQVAVYSNVPKVTLQKLELRNVGCLEVAKDKAKLKGVNEGLKGVHEGLKGAALKVVVSEGSVVEKVSVLDNKVHYYCGGSHAVYVGTTGLTSYHPATKPPTAPSAPDWEKGAKIESAIVSGNELQWVYTAWSEALTVTGNIDGVLVEGNAIFGASFIGIDIIGSELEEGKLEEEKKQAAGETTEETAERHKQCLARCFESDSCVKACGQPRRIVFKAIDAPENVTVRNNWVSDGRHKETTESLKEHNSPLKEREVLSQPKNWVWTNQKKCLGQVSSTKNATCNLPDGSAVGIYVDGAMDATVTDNTTKGFKYGYSVEVESELPVTLKVVTLTNNDSWATAAHETVGIHIGGCRCTDGYAKRAKDKDGKPIPGLAAPFQWRGAMGSYAEVKLGSNRHTHINRKSKAPRRILVLEGIGPPSGLCLSCDEKKRCSNCLFGVQGKRGVVRQVTLMDPLCEGANKVDDGATAKRPKAVRAPLLYDWRCDSVKTMLPLTAAMRGRAQALARGLEEDAPKKKGHAAKKVKEVTLWPPQGPSSAPKTGSTISVWNGRDSAGSWAFTCETPKPPDTKGKKP